MLIHFILYACLKYERYFSFNGIDSMDTSHVMVQKYNRLKEIWDECHKKELSDEQAEEIFGSEVGELYHAIQGKEFVCKVNRVAFLGELKMIAEFRGDYYTEIDFEEVLQLPKVQEKYPELENLRKPEVFHNVYPFEYHVYFGEHPDKVDVSSDFIWHFGKEIKHQIDEAQYEWIRGF